MAEANKWVRELLWSREPTEARDASGWAWTQSHHRLTISVVLLALSFSAVCGWVLLEARRATAPRATEVATSLANSLQADIARNVELLSLSLEGVMKNLKLPGLDRLSPEMRQLVLFDYSATARHPTSMFVVDAA